MQHWSTRQARTEERVLQLFRLLNDVLDRRKETRKRGLTFNTPSMVPLSPHVRIIQDEPSFTSLEDIYEDHCSRTGMSPDEPIIYFQNRLRQFPQRQNKLDMMAHRLEVFQEVLQSKVPSDILSKFMTRTYVSFTDLWMCRKQFTLQYAAASLMTFSFFIGQRMAHKINIALNTGSVLAGELQPSFTLRCELDNNEAVSMRLTPNIQVSKRKKNSWKMGIVFLKNIYFFKS